MRKLFMAVAVATAGLTHAALAQNITVGVSWSNFQEERWKTDEAAINLLWKQQGRSMSAPTRSPHPPNNCPTWKA